MLIVDAGGFEFSLVGPMGGEETLKCAKEYWGMDLRFIDSLENILEATVILFKDSILSGHKLNTSISRDF